MNLPEDVLGMIAEYCVTHPKQLRSWVDPHRIIQRDLCANPVPEAIDLVSQYPEKIDYYYLSDNSNPKAISLLRNNPHRISWRELNRNTCDDAIEILLQYPEKIDYYDLSGNSCSLATSILQKNPENIVWSTLSRNSSDYAVSMLLAHPHNIDWNWICHNTNPRVLELIEKNIDRIQRWRLYQNPIASQQVLQIINNNNIVDQCQSESLCTNTSPEIIEYLQNNPQYIDWSSLSGNPSAIKILENNVKNIDWFGLCKNPEAGKLLQSTNAMIYWDVLATNPCIFQTNAKEYRDKVNLFTKRLLDYSSYPF